MTTLPQYRGADNVYRQLGWLARRRRVVGMVAGTCWLAAAMAAGVLLATAVLGYWAEQPPRALRWGVLLIDVAAVAVALAAGPLRWLVRRPNAAQTARFAEAALGGLDNALINTVQLAADESAQPELVQAAIDETASRLGAVELARAVDFAGCTGQPAWRQGWPSRCWGWWCFRGRGWRGRCWRLWTWAPTCRRWARWRSWALSRATRPYTVARA